MAFLTKEATREGLNKRNSQIICERAGAAAAWRGGPSRLEDRRTALRVNFEKKLWEDLLRPLKSRGCSTRNQKTKTGARKQRRDLSGQ